MQLRKRLKVAATDCYTSTKYRTSHCFLLSVDSGEDIGLEEMEAKPSPSFSRSLQDVVVLSSELRIYRFATSVMPFPCQVTSLPGGRARGAASLHMEEAIRGVISSSHVPGVRVRC